MSHAYADSFFQDCPDQNIDAMWAAYADSFRIEELESENAKLRELLQASLCDFRRIYSCDEQDGWKMVDAIDRMVIGMRELGLDVGRTEQEMRVKVDG